MRKLRASILSIMVSLFMLLPIMEPTQKVEAGNYELTYNVYWDCTCPDGGGRMPCDFWMGSWTRDCSGDWSGWGAEPGTECTYYYTSTGSPCE